jgi:hypothetical protein
MLARVSHIESFRRWRLDESQDAADLVARLLDFQPTEAMQAGTAFHKALELAKPGRYETLEALGYTFLLPEDGVIALPNVRELRCYGSYGPLRVTGQVDALEGLRVDDHKTTAQFNAEGYWEGCQWRFYLDIFGADVFRWNVFPITPVRGKEKTYTVAAPQILEQCRYPRLHDDCMALASDYYDFAIKHMPRLEAA